MGIFRKDDKEIQYWTVLKPDGTFNTDRITNSIKEAEDDLTYIGLGYEVSKDLKLNPQRKKIAIEILKKEGYQITQLIIKTYP